MQGKADASVTRTRGSVKRSLRLYERCLSDTREESRCQSELEQVTPLQANLWGAAVSKRRGQVKHHHG